MDFNQGYQITNKNYVIIGPFLGGTWGITGKFSKPQPSKVFAIAKIFNQV
jgi:hypothetical protein